MARRIIGGLADRLAAETLEDARLLLTELMTNAIRHSGIVEGGVITVRIYPTADELTVEVSDPGQGFVARTGSGPSRGSGWGLFLLGQVAANWGTTARRDGGSIVWFTLPLGPA
ncbi:MAG: ATP-binding protein [Actinomycetota bacterium]